MRNQFQSYGTLRMVKINQGHPTPAQSKKKNSDSDQIGIEEGDLRAQMGTLTLMKQSFFRSVTITLPSLFKAVTRDQHMMWIKTELHARESHH